MTLTWQEPPPSPYQGTHGRYSVVADALRERPGEWALILNAKSQSHAGQLRLSPYFAGGFELTSRKAANGRYDIYARYIGATS